MGAPGLRGGRTREQAGWEALLSFAEALAKVSFSVCSGLPRAQQAFEFPFSAELAL